MSGDHNMNQFTYNKAISGAAQPVQSLREETEQYQGEIDRQITEMQSALYLLASTVETLRQRLKPVMCDRPCKESGEALSNTQSPLGLALQQYNANIKASCQDVLHIIESLEI